MAVSSHALRRTQNGSDTEGGTVAARGNMVFDPNTGAPDGSGREVYTLHGQPNIIPVAAPMQKAAIAASSSE